MKILIGVDDSPHSKAAVAFVTRMTWPKNTSVVVVSVALSPVAAYVDVPVRKQVAAVASEDLLRLHQEIASKAEDALKAAHLRTEAKALQGDPRTALVDAAHRESADLLVVGSHGRTGLMRLLMGSVATHVITHAPCSVLVVKLDKRAAA